jgi:putative drug exporter of the RND superfamily
MLGKEESLMFAKLGAWCHDRRKLVLGIWLALLVVGGGLSNAVGSAFRDEFNLPDVESKTGFDILDENFGGQGTGQRGTIVFRADQGVQDPAVRQAMQGLFDKVATIEGVDRVESPYAPEAAQQIASRGPDAGKIAFAHVEMPEDMDFARGFEIRKEIAAEAPRIDGLRVEYGGAIFAEFKEPSSEILGVAFAVVILIVAFGSVLAMGLPVGVALFGIGIGTTIITLLATCCPYPTSPPSSGS